MSSDTPLHRPAPHESGHLHVTGEALYVDDLDEPRGTLVGQLVPSPHARARIVSRDASTALDLPGVEAVLFADDLPGDPRIGPIVHDEPILAGGEVFFAGQAVALVLATSPQAARAGVAAVDVQYEQLEPILGIQAAIEADSFLTAPHVIARGNLESALDEAEIVLEGTAANGGQDHFYLETQAALAVPDEDDTLVVYSSTQHPTEIQKMIARTLDLGSHQVVVKVPRLGGGFGGKESQATNYGCLAAFGAWATGRPVKVWLDREQDMRFTGGRHPFWSTWRAGFDADGTLRGLEVRIYSDGGWSSDLSGPVLDRALFHIDNAYFVPALRFEGRVCRTNVASSTAFRGFGGPQGMLVLEQALDRFAERQGLDPAEVRRRNYYGGAPRNLAPYDQEVPDVRIHRIHDDLLASAGYVERRQAIAAFNQGQAWVRRGIGYQPVKFGISFTASLLNQAGALVLVYADGTVQLNHGGTEMGQGLHTKMRTICAHELGVAPERVRVMATATDKVPNTSATAASSGSDLNGQAVREACEAIRERMRPVAARMLEIPTAEAHRIRFAGGRCRFGGRDDRSVPFSDVANTCWVQQVSLSATGYYRTPGIWYDRTEGRGKPFHYFAWGGAVVEVEVNGLTGEHRLRRVDILHDVGDSLVPTIDVGQIEGGFLQGWGWLTCEEVVHDEQGQVLTTGPSTYKIPAFGDCPADLRVELLERAPQPDSIHGSKAVGEPPFMLAIGAIHALRHAIGSWGPGEIELAIPATPEAILRAVETQRARAEAAKKAAK